MHNDIYSHKTPNFENLVIIFHCSYMCVRVCIERERNLEDKGIVGGFSGGGKSSWSHGRFDVATIARGSWRRRRRRRRRKCSSSSSNVMDEEVGVGHGMHDKLILPSLFSSLFSSLSAHLHLSLCVYVCDREASERN